jgi:hypothetical protein
MGPVASSPGPVRFRPMPLPELLDELFRLYRRHFSLIIGVALIVVLPSLLWTLITGTYKLTSTSIANIFTSTGGGVTPSFNSTQFSSLFGTLAIGGIGGLILLPFTVGAVYRAVTDVALGRAVTVGGVLRETLAKYFPLLGLVGIFYLLAIAWVFAEIIGFVLLVIPGLIVLGVAIYLGVRWLLVVAAMMAEDVGPINGMRRSWNLVGGMWWRTFGIVIVLAILQVVINLALGLLVTIILSVGLSGDLRLAVAAIVSTLLNALVSPIFTIGLVLLYFDLRVRKEGLDLDQLARQTTPGPAPV